MDIQLSDGLKQLGLTLDESVQEKMLQYIQLLAKWNRTYNLTAVRDPKQMVTRHLLDSLSILPYLGTENVVDIGSGAGLPGIPLSLCCPNTKFTLLDSNGKKTRFMLQVSKELDLANVQVIKARVEDYKPENTFGFIISRAFSSLANLLKLSKHLCDSNTQILAMKGTYPLAEMDEVKDAEKFIKVVRLDIPGVNAERHLAIINCSKFKH